MRLITHQEKKKRSYTHFSFLIYISPLSLILSLFKRYSRVRMQLGFSIWLQFIVFWNFIEYYYLQLEFVDESINPFFLVYLVKGHVSNFEKHNTRKMKDQTDLPPLMQVSSVDLPGLLLLCFFFPLFIWCF